MDPVTTQTVMTTMVVSWDAASDSGEEVDAYDVQLMNMAGQFVNDAMCSGAIENGLLCLFSHDYLLLTYSFPVGHIVQFRVRAHNTNGWGQWSQSNTGDAYIQTVPS